MNFIGSFDLSCVVMLNNHDGIELYNIVLNKFLYSSIGKTRVCIKTISGQLNSNLLLPFP